MIYIVNSGIVLANDQPALKHVHLMQPAIRALSDTEYLILLKHGTALESMDSRLAQMRSSDAGKTWQEEGFLEQTVQKDEPVYSYFCPHLTLLRDGRLLVLSVRFRRDDPNLRCYNPETGGCLRPPSARRECGTSRWHREKHQPDHVRPRSLERALRQRTW